VLAPPCFLARRPDSRRETRGQAKARAGVTRVQVLRSENIFTFQLTADIGFLEGRRYFQTVKKISWADMGKM